MASAGVPMKGAPHVHRDGATALWTSVFTDPDGHHLALGAVDVRFSILGMARTQAVPFRDYVTLFSAPTDGAPCP